MSSEGPDGGVDILAGRGQLGFGSPSLCVEVKSGDTPSDRPAVENLLRAVAKFGAQEVHFVSWAGFKSYVHKEMAQSFFRIRLWSQIELLEALFANYERLDDEIKAELPLKGKSGVHYARVRAICRQDNLEEQIKLGATLGETTIPTFSYYKYLKQINVKCG